VWALQSAHRAQQAHTKPYTQRITAPNAQTVPTTTSTLPRCAIRVLRARRHYTTVLLSANSFPHHVLPASLLVNPRANPHDNPLVSQRDNRRDSRQDSRRANQQIGPPLIPPCNPLDSRLVYRLWSLLASPRPVQRLCLRVCRVRNHPLCLLATPLPCQPFTLLPNLLLSRRNVLRGNLRRNQHASLRADHRDNRHASQRASRQDSLRASLRQGQRSSLRASLARGLLDHPLPILRPCHLPNHQARLLRFQLLCHLANLLANLRVSQQCTPR